MPPPSLSRLPGIGYGAGAYLIWGLFPAFFGLLAFAAPMEILAHRIVWTVVAMLALLTVTGRLRTLAAIPGRAWALSAVAAAAIAVNWGVYVYGVITGHVVECALGYFVTPLVSVLFGVMFFGERLSPAQLAAVALATVAVTVITVAYGRAPWIALVLAGSFAVYGVIKKVVPLDPMRSLTAEGLVTAPLALTYLGYLVGTGGSALGGSLPHAFLLVAAGPVTAVPLLLFGAAARRVPLVTMGLLQYLTPALQMAWGVLVGHEAMPTSRWIGFGLIWLALAIFVADSLHGRRTAVLR
ncbi:EamA family transporter RarD [Skermania piniformis]|uniref:EamA family transporter RarD n=2 Tax=Skermania pinensis TaxID=39122 RepID=A0ABX8SFK4_9ACTN|nr:EamA family transporter RarD [Skermania piniformis]